jgi:tetratricopeptide (TPR) repeat protein
VSVDQADPYSSFLDSASVESWRECLGLAVQRTEVAGETEGGARPLAEALCISVYLRWLAASSGDDEARREANRQLDALLTLLRARTPDPSDDARRLCWTIALSAGGFRGRAKQFLEGNELAGAEHRLLVSTGSGVRELETLRALVVGVPHVFLPAVSEYGTLLVRSGFVHEARAVVDESGFEPSEPLLVDVLASASERLGEWSRAYVEYSQSPWPEHRYRAAIVGTIARGRTEDLSSIQFDKPMRDQLGRFRGELDQTDLNTSIAFLNACSSGAVEDWLVEFELGTIAFRRRRYLEANLHLGQALRYAPPEVRLPVAELRFTNLTWLSGRAPYLALDLLPEALAVGAEALALTEDESRGAAIRTWLADNTNDLALIPPTIDEWGAFDRGEAYRLIGEPDRAIDCWLESLADSYYHRSVTALAQELARAGFRRTVSVLADIVMQESSDDFFALWETARTLGTLTGTQPESEDEESDHPLNAFVDRIVDLTHFDFKNSIRAYELMVDIGRLDRAEELLLRATRQADGVSELVAVSVVRRRADDPLGVPDDEEALGCLARALDESRDRLERLEIAREFFHRRRERDARRILVEERIFDPQEPLSHVEMTAALQCGPWLTAAERSDLARRAVDHLGADQASGLLGTYGHFYVERLLATLNEYDQELHRRVQAEIDTAIRPQPSTEWSGEGAGAWNAIRDRLTDYEDDQPSVATLTADEEEEPPETTLDAGESDASFGRRLMIILALRERLAELLGMAADTRPSVAPDETPLYESDDVGAGARTIELCDLWRARVVASSGPDVKTADLHLRAFFAGEQELLERWERSIVVAREPILRRIARVGELLLSHLEQPEFGEELVGGHPVLRDVASAIALDLEALAAEAGRELESAREVLARAIRESESVERAGATH